MKKNNAFGLISIENLKLSHHTSLSCGLDFEIRTRLKMEN
jgi:hypothetical protein